MIQLIIYGIMAVAAATAFGLWHHSITVAGENAGIQKQFAADKPILDECSKRGNADPANCVKYIEALIVAEAQREAELATLTEAETRQKAALDLIAKQSASAVAAIQAAKAKQLATQKDFDARQAELSQLAGKRVNETLACTDELTRVNSVLDSYKRTH
jgi:hypothetical protein